MLAIKIILMFPITGFLLLFFLWPVNDEDATWADVVKFLVVELIVISWMFDLVALKQLVLFSP